MYIALNVTIFLLNAYIQRVVDKTVASLQIYTVFA